jgi:formiminotetrahydrofolate cyclodeaminase
MLISDVGCGAACAAAAMQAAALNVFINTKGLQDRDYAAQVEAEADELLAYVPRAQKVADEVAEGIRG